MATAAKKLISGGMFRRLFRRSSNDSGRVVLTGEYGRSE